MHCHLSVQNKKGNLFFDKKSKELQYEQAKRKKAQGIFNAAIDTASAIIGFLANPSGWPGVALSILAGITGAVQIAALASQPLPQLAEGGIVPATPGGRAVVVGEGGQDEAIIPLDDSGAGTGPGMTHVIVNIAGQPIIDVIQDAINRQEILIEAV